VLAEQQVVAMTMVERRFEIVDRATFHNDVALLGSTVKVAAKLLLTDCRHR
jgi:hypothetical protein